MAAELAYRVVQKNQGLQGFLGPPETVFSPPHHCLLEEEDARRGCSSSSLTRAIYGFADLRPLGDPHIEGAIRPESCYRACHKIKKQGFSCFNRL